MVKLNAIPTPNTMNASKKLAKKTKAKLVPFVINTKGSGSDLISFMIADHEKYDFLLKIDGDGQQEVDDLEKLYQVLKNGQGDIAVGSRYLKNQKETDSFIRVIGRVTTSALLNFKLRGKNKISDCTSGIRAWNHKSIKMLNEHYDKKDLVNDSMFWVREDLIATRMGLKIYEIPVFYNERKFGKSKSFSLINMIGFPFRFLILFLFQ